MGGPTEKRGRHGQRACAGFFALGEATPSRVDALPRAVTVENIENFAGYPLATATRADYAEMLLVAKWEDPVEFCGIY